MVQAQKRPAGEPSAVEDAHRPEWEIEEHRDEAEGPDELPEAEHRKAREGCTEAQDGGQPQQSEASLQGL